MRERPPTGAKDGNDALRAHVRQRERCEECTQTFYGKGTYQVHRGGVSCCTPNSAYQPLQASPGRGCGGSRRPRRRVGLGHGTRLPYVRVDGDKDRQDDAADAEDQHCRDDAERLEQQPGERRPQRRAGEDDPAKMIR